MSRWAKDRVSRMCLRNAWILTKDISVTSSPVSNCPTIPAGSSRVSYRTHGSGAPRARPAGTMRFSDTEDVFCVIMCSGVLFYSISSWFPSWVLLDLLQVKSGKQSPVLGQEPGLARTPQVCTPGLHEHVLIPSFSAFLSNAMAQRR